MGLRMAVLNVRTASDIDAAFSTIVQNRIGALVTASDPFLLGRREQIIALAAQHSIPTIYSIREFVEVGGLMSYGNNLRNAYRRVGAYAARILKGANPAILPVDRTAKFELVINLKQRRRLVLRCQYAYSCNSMRRSSSELSPRRGSLPVPGAQGQWPLARRSFHTGRRTGYAEVSTCRAALTR